MHSNPRLRGCFCCVLFYPNHHLCASQVVDMIFRNECRETESHSIVIEENVDRHTFRVFLHVCHGGIVGDDLSVDDGNLESLLGLLHFYQVVREVALPVEHHVIVRLTTDNVTSIYHLSGLYEYHHLRQAALELLIEHSVDFLGCPQHNDNLGMWVQCDVVDFLSHSGLQVVDERVVYRFVKTWFGVSGIACDDTLQSVLGSCVRWSCMPIHHLREVVEENVVECSVVYPYLIRPMSGQPRSPPVALHILSDSENVKKCRWSVAVERLVDDPVSVVVIKFGEYNVTVRVTCVKEGLVVYVVTWESTAAKRDDAANEFLAVEISFCGYLHRASVVTDTGKLWCKRIDAFPLADAISKPGISLQDCSFGVTLLRR